MKEPQRRTPNDWLREAVQRERARIAGRDRRSLTRMLAEDTASAEADEDAPTATLDRVEQRLAEAGAVYPDVLLGRIPAEVRDDPQALAASIDALRRQYPDLFTSRPRTPSGGLADGAAKDARRSARPSFGSAMSAAMREALWRKRSR